MRFITKTDESIIFDLDEKSYDGQTVGDLKKRLSEMPFVGLVPEEQRIQYDGIVLTNDMLLSDILGDKRHVFVLTKTTKDSATNDNNKIPLRMDYETANCSNSKASEENSTLVEINDEEGAAGGEVFDEDMELPADLECYYSRSVEVDEDLVKTIVDMGYDACDVRAALLASFNHPDRAIEYLVDGIPMSLRMTLPRSPPMTPTCTPPQSYRGSLCSSYSALVTPPEPRSPTLSTTTSGSDVFNNMEELDLDRRDSDDSTNLLMDRKKKQRFKHKRRMAEAAAWAATTTPSAVSSLENVVDKLTTSSQAPTQSIDSLEPIYALTSKADEMDMDIDENHSRANAAGGDHGEPTTSGF